MTLPDQPADALPEQWSRLNPLSPVVKAGRGLIGLIVVLVGNGAESHEPRYVDIGILAIAVAAAITSWLVTRWRIQRGELQIDTGLIRRQQVRVPLTRIQGIDIVRPLVARMLGVSEVRLLLAGHSSGRARLAYLAEDRATEVRAQLLALAHGLHEQTPEPPERPVIAVPGGRVVAANLLATRFAIGLLLVAYVVGLSIVDDAAIGPSFGGLFALFTITLAVTFRKVSAEWEFRVAEAPDGLRIRGGLLQTRSETIPYGRIQAVRWVEPLWWRPFGWVRLEVDVARRRSSDRAERESGSASKALLPVGTREDARWLLSRVLPGASAELPVTGRGPRRTAWRVPLARRFLRAGHDDRYAVCSTGRLRPNVVVVPLEKVQSIRWSQGPWSRRLGLASVELDTAGQRFTAKGRFRDTAQAEQWMAELPPLASAARQQASAARQQASGVRR